MAAYVNVYSFYLNYYPEYIIPAPAKLSDVSALAGEPVLLYRRAGTLDVIYSPDGVVPGGEWFMVRNGPFFRVISGTFEKKKLDFS